MKSLLFKTLFICCLKGSDWDVGFLAFLANGASPQQAIKVVKVAIEDQGNLIK